MSTQTCSLRNIDSNLSQFLQESIDKCQELAKADKQTSSCESSYCRRLNLEEDKKIRVEVSIWIMRNANMQYDISSLEGHVTIWTQELQSDNISTDRVRELLRLTQSITEIYTPIFKQYNIPLRDNPVW